MAHTTDTNDWQADDRLGDPPEEEVTMKIMISETAELKDVSRDFATYLAEMGAYGRMTDGKVQRFKSVTEEGTYAAANAGTFEFYAVSFAAGVL